MKNLQNSFDSITNVVGQQVTFCAESGLGAKLVQLDFQYKLGCRGAG